MRPRRRLGPRRQRHRDVPDAGVAEPPQVLDDLRRRPPVRDGQLDDTVIERRTRAQQRKPARGEGVGHREPVLQRAGHPRHRQPGHHRAQAGLVDPRPDGRDQGVRGDPVVGGDAVAVAHGHRVGPQAAGAQFVGEHGRRVGRRGDRAEQQ